MRFRGFQQWLHDRFSDVETLGLRCPEEIILDVGCGGGKGVAVVIIAYWLIERLHVVDRVLWVVPNGSLRRQAAQAFGPHEVAAQLLGHRLEIIESGNVGNPAKGTHGYALTFASSAAARLRGDGWANPHVEELSTYRYAVVGDEPHHLVAAGADAQERGYTRGMYPLLKLAKVRVFMSGTLFRHDRKPIAFLPYVDGMVDEQETDTRWFRRYTLREAIDDQAVIKPEFHLSDGRASWVYAGQAFEADSIKADTRALFTALQTGFATQLLTQCVLHWQGWRRDHPRSKLLVVCARESQAKQMQRYMTKHLGVQAEVATYREEDADERIDRFKGPSVHALITVNKAYEGLDVPSITHLASLTHIRSIPWLNQMLARAWRFDAKGEAYRDQVAFVFAPADQLFQEAIQRIWEAFRHRALDVDDDGMRGGGSGPDDAQDAEPREVVTPRTSELTETIGRDFEQEWPDLSGLQARLIARGIGPMRLDVLAAIMDELAADNGEPKQAEERINGAGYRTPGQRLSDLKANLADYVAEVARRMADANGLERGEYQKIVNAEIVRRWRARSLMEEPEVEAAISWVRQHYGID